MSRNKIFYVHQLLPLRKLEHSPELEHTVPCAQHEAIPAVVLDRQQIPYEAQHVLPQHFLAFGQQNGLSSE